MAKPNGDDRARKLKAFEDFKAGRITADQLEAELSGKQFRVEASEWNGFAMLRIMGGFAPKNLRTTLVRSILDHADEVKKACDKAESLVS